MYSNLTQLQISSQICTQLVDIPSYILINITSWWKYELISDYIEMI